MVPGPVLLGSPQVLARLIAEDLGDSPAIDEDRDVDWLFGRGIIRGPAFDLLAGNIVDMAVEHQVPIRRM